VILSRYLNTSFEQFEWNFLRDLHPEREILIWTLIADAHQRFRAEYRSATDEEAKAAFKGLLLISMGTCRPVDIPQAAWDKLQDIYANRQGGGALQHSPGSRIVVAARLPESSTASVMIHSFSPSNVRWAESRRERSSRACSFA
jgi:hypothetical protein